MSASTLEACKTYHQIENAYAFALNDGANCNSDTEITCEDTKKAWLRKYEGQSYQCVASEEETKLGAGDCKSALIVENYTCTKAAQ